MKLLKHIILAVVIGSFLMPNFVAAEAVYIRDINVELLNDGQAKITWSTNLPTSGMVLYSEDDSYRYAVGTSLTSVYSEVIIANLKVKTNYNFKIVANYGGQSTTSFAQKFKTGTWKITKPLNISDVRSIYIGGSNLAVRWYSDRESNSAIEAVLASDYMAQGFSKSVKKASNGAQVTNHQLTIKGLKPSASYYYRVRSKDRDGNEAISGEFYIATQATDANDKSDLKITKIAPASSPDPLIGNNAVTFIWQTNRPAVGYVQIKDESRGGLNTKVQEQGFASYDHRLTVTGLNPRSTYSYKIYAADVVGKKLTTDQRLVRTNAEPVVAGASTSIYSESTLGLVPPAVKPGYKYYTEVPRDIALEQEVAAKLRTYLQGRFGRVPTISPTNWFTIVRAFTYGGYTVDSVGQAVKWGGKTVHPAIFWSVWQKSPDYQNYINR